MGTKSWGKGRETGRGKPQRREETGKPRKTRITRKTAGIGVQKQVMSSGVLGRSGVEQAAEPDVSGVANHGSFEP